MLNIAVNVQVCDENEAGRSTKADNKKIILNNKKNYYFYVVA
jgi:hypothetical protein